LDEAGYQAVWKRQSKEQWTAFIERIVADHSATVVGRDMLEITVAGQMHTRHRYRFLLDDLGETGWIKGWVGQDGDWGYGVPIMGEETWRAIRSGEQ